MSLYPPKKHFCLNSSSYYSQKLTKCEEKGPDEDPQNLNDHPPCRYSSSRLIRSSIIRTVIIFLTQCQHLHYTFHLRLSQHLIVHGFKLPALLQGKYHYPCFADRENRLRVFFLPFQKERRHLLCLKDFTGG